VPATPLAATDDPFGLQVRSGEHGAALVLESCPRHAGAGLHLPCRSDQKPAPGGAWLIAASTGDRKHAFSASLSASDRSRHGGWRHPRFEGLSAGLALPPPGQGHTASAITAAGHDCTGHGMSRVGARPNARAIVPEGQSPRPMPARVAVQHYALTNKTKARVTPGSICARRNCVDGWLPERNTGGAERLPLFHPLSCASDVSAYAARRRLATRLSLARRGFFSPVRG
jgi:hypothetical protein